MIKKIIVKVLLFICLLLIAFLFVKQVTISRYENVSKEDQQRIMQEEAESAAYMIMFQ